MFPVKGVVTWHFLREPAGDGNGNMELLTDHHQGLKLKLLHCPHPLLHLETYSTQCQNSFISVFFKLRTF